MNITQIRDTLNSIFNEKKKRIIFWYDGEKEFEEILPELALENTVDLIILAALTKADSPELFTIFMRLFKSFCGEGKYKPDTKSELWADLKKNGNGGTFPTAAFKNLRVFRPGTCQSL